MKLFPTKNVTVELRNDRATTLTELRRHTQLTDTLVSEYTGKLFIGQVTESGFKIISSEIGRGAVCVFVGELQETTGHIEIRIHKAFKILFSILMLMPLIGLGISLATQGIERSLGPLFAAIVGILFIRLVLIGLSFRFTSKTGFNTLIGIMRIKHLT